MRQVLLRVVLLYVFCGFCVDLMAQPRRVTGTVMDEQGNVLPGASVSVKGTQLSTGTDANGAFTLNVPAGSDVLVISFVGMTRQEVSIGNRSNIRIVLQENTTSLSEVVVVDQSVKLWTDQSVKLWTKHIFSLSGT